MAKCVGCGLEVNNGVLEVNLKDNGGIICNPQTGELSINFAPDGEGGNGQQLGCGLTATEAAIQLDLGTNATCGNVVKNLLTCVPGDGLRADHNYSIASNSAACGFGSQFEGGGLNGVGTTMVVSPTGYNFFTPLVTIKPDCICANGNPTGDNWCWTGNTLFDVGGIQVEAQPNSLIEVTFNLHQDFLGNPATTFGGLNPSYRVTIDNTNFGFLRRHDLVLHDTTWQIFGCSGIQFKLQLHIEVIQGSGRVFAFTAQQYEINWHYSHCAPAPRTEASVQGCTPPPP